MANCCDNKEDTKMNKHNHGSEKALSGYRNFFAMIISSTTIMLGLMYLNTYAFDHIFFSETRTYMAIYMGAVMAIVMLSFMLGMYKNKKANLAIFVGSIIVFSASLYLVRSQATIEDNSWMKAMIPHHSIAVLTSERANIDDVRVKELANSIIKAQRREIKEMKWLIDDINKNGLAKTDAEANQRPVPKFKGEL
jgi:ABC-type lipoprotein release transport system permease subunit